MPSFFTAIIFFTIFGGIKIFFAYWLFCILDFALWTALKGGDLCKIKISAIGVKGTNSKITAIFLGFVILLAAQSTDVSIAFIFFLLTRKIFFLSGYIIFLCGMIYMIIFPYDIRIICIGVYIIKYFIKNFK